MTPSWPGHNPTAVVLETLDSVHKKSSSDPRHTFVNLLSAAIIAGKMMGLTNREIRRKIRELEVPTNSIKDMISQLEIKDADNSGKKRP